MIHTFGSKNHTFRYETKVGLIQSSRKLYISTQEVYKKCGILTPIRSYTGNETRVNKIVLYLK